MLLKALKIIGFPIVLVAVIWINVLCFVSYWIYRLYVWTYKELE